MLKLISKISSSAIVCWLLSGCGHYGITSLYVQNSSIQQPIKKTDKIVILAARPDLENSEEFKTSKFRTKFHFQERGYTVIEKNNFTKPSLFALLEPSVIIKPHTVTREVCKRDFPKFIGFYQEAPINPNDPDVTCHDENNIFYTYIYDYSLTIYRPGSICHDTTQCINSRNYKYNSIFSSHIHYNKGKPLSNNEMFLIMTDAIFSTFPLNQNSLVYFQKTPDGYIPTQVKKE